MNYRIDNSPGIGNQIAAVCLLLLLIAGLLIGAVTMFYRPGVSPDDIDRQIRDNASRVE